MIMIKTDINCDLGEMEGSAQIAHDEELMQYISSANIACGFHAGNALTMSRTILLAKKYGVAAGAHPGYPDREGFGRHEIKMSIEELQAVISYQVGALKAIAESSGINLNHVKCHGALYNTAAADYSIAHAIADAVSKIDKSLIIFGLSGSELIRAAADSGLAYASEVFADRAYNDDGSLVSRTKPGAVIHDVEIVIQRAVMIIREKKVVSVTGRTIAIEADTICLHGDNPEAAVFARALRNALRESMISVEPIVRR
jgi:5-oxoprolinase (ATP-hydrolysing) subunit A